MIRFSKALPVWPDPAFREVLKQEIEALDAGALPLQQGLAQSSHAVGPVTALILGVEETPGRLFVRAGLFYAGIIAGCSCADDPTPVDEVSEYCVVRFDIDRITAEAAVTLLPE